MILAIESSKLLHIQIFNIMYFLIINNSCGFSSLGLSYPCCHGNPGCGVLHQATTPQEETISWAHIPQERKCIVHSIAVIVVFFFPGNFKKTHLVLAQHYKQKLTVLLLLMRSLDIPRFLKTIPNLCLQRCTHLCLYFWIKEQTCTDIATHPLPHSLSLWSTTGRP